MAKRAVIRAISNIDIRLVHIFLKVTECGGFAASELELNIGRSTISKHIADLEARVGLKLCNRGPSGFSLTLEGEKFIQVARKLLTSIDNFQSDIDNIHANLTGTLRLGVFDQSSTNPAAKIHEAIRAFDQVAPQVELEIALSPPSILEARVTDGTMDVAVVPMYKQSTLLNYTTLYREKMTLYCGHGHEFFDLSPDVILTQKDLTDQKYAGYAFNSPNLKAGHVLGIARAARVEEEEALVLLVQSGRYLGFLADHVAEEFVRTGKMRAIAPSLTSYSTTFAAITRKKPEPDRKTQEFMASLVAAHNNDTAFAG